MRKSALLCAVALLGALLFSSCNTGGSVITVYDGELQWSTLPYARISNATDNDGNVVIWAPHLMTEIGNSLRGVNFMITTCEPGTYSGVYDAASEKWTTSAIQYITLNVDYDGTPYPTWRGQSATLTIQSYNRRTKRINATLDAIVLMDGSSNTRNIRIEMQNMNVEGR